MDWYSLGGSLVGAISNIVGSSKAQQNVADINKTNLQISRENNQFNADEAEKSRQWSESMWHKQNEYNKASEQVKRLREAGINPFIANANVLESIAGAPVQGASASSAGLPTMQNSAPYINSSFNAVGDIANGLVKSIAEVEKLRAETKKIGADTKYTDRAMDLLNNQISTEYWKSKIAELDFGIKDKNKDNVIKQAIADIVNTETDTAEKRSRIDLNELFGKTEVEKANLTREEKKLVVANINRIERLLPLEESNMIADTSNKRADTSMKYAQGSYYSASAEVQKEIVEKTREELRKISYEIDNLSADEAKKRMETALMPYDFNLRERQVIADILASQKHSWSVGPNGLSFTGLDDSNVEEKLEKYGLNPSMDSGFARSLVEILGNGKPKRR